MKKILRIFVLAVSVLLGLIILAAAQSDHKKISETEGNFTGTLETGDYFGSPVVRLGDLNGDNIDDLAVGAPFDDDGGTNRGAIWILFMNTDNTVKSHQKIGDTEGNFTGMLDNGDEFGISIASLGDLDGDNINDLAVGACYDDDGGSSLGAVWVLYMNRDGTVKSHQKISKTEGNFTGTLDSDEAFGCSIARIGDLDGDNVIDIAVGAYLDDDGGHERGAVWILFLNTDATVKSYQKISDYEGNFTSALHNGDAFGVSVASLGDLDEDNVTDLAVGAHCDDVGGAVWVLFMNTNGTVRNHIRRSVLSRVILLVYWIMAMTSVFQLPT